MSTPVYSYFYPLSTSCPERQSRALQHNVTLADETELAQRAEPLFDGHQQPNTYCIGDPSKNTWDDADPSAMAQQVDLARDHGVDGFIFDTYLGQKQGRRVHEMADVLDHAFLENTAVAGMKFAIMSVLGSPRVVLPVPRNTGYEEQDRYYDPTRGTVETIVDHAAKNYWDHEDYIRILGRPYLSIFTSDMRKAAGEEGALSLPDTIEYMKEYAERRYGVEPYIAGVCLKAKHALPLFERGADAMTGYAFLPNFGANSEPVQDHADLLAQRVSDWEMITSQLNKPYVPPVVVGWDASPRGISGSRIEDVSGVYPFTPIVTGSDSQLFGEMLVKQRNFVEAHVPPNERYTPVTAWNEITEGAALLPKVNPDGSINKDYLDVLKQARTGQSHPD